MSVAMIALVLGSTYLHVTTLIAGQKLRMQPVTRSGLPCSLPKAKSRRQLPSMIATMIPTEKLLRFSNSRQNCCLNLHPMSFEDAPKFPRVPQLVACKGSNNAAHAY